jgi:cytochrome P450
MVLGLRLYPPVPMNIRIARRPAVLPNRGGPDVTSPIIVQKGEMANFGQYVQSLRKNIYSEDAHYIRPERRETGELANTRWAYAPFNSGLRQCIRDRTLTEVSNAIARLLQIFVIILLPLGERNKPVGTEL